MVNHIYANGALTLPFCGPRDAEPPDRWAAWSSGLPAEIEAARKRLMRHMMAECDGSALLSSDGDDDDDDEAETAATERERIATLLATFRDDNVSQRRDTELQRIARNKLLDELGAWLDDGGKAYEPKD